MQSSAMVTGNTAKAFISLRLDNPGWLIKINLLGTASEEAVFENVNIDKAEDNWLRCFKEGGEFTGAGDPSKLPVILEHFLKFVGKL